MKEQFTDHVNIELLPGDGGIFLVSADNATLFSKRNHNRFPEHEEIISLVQKVLG